MKIYLNIAIKSMDRDQAIDIDLDVQIKEKPLIWPAYFVWFSAVVEKIR